jgi:predicted hydrocarbon binding protein
MNITRNDLALADATMNQLRNAIYHLARFMIKNDVSDLKNRFRKMGRNIAKTYYMHWDPIDIVSLTNIREVIATVYKEVLKSSVTVNINEAEQIIIVNDSNCALCKYQYDDIEIAGCEIILGLISEYITQINMHSKKKPELTLNPARVQESKALGNKSCVHIYNYTRGEY